MNVLVGGTTYSLWKTLGNNVHSSFLSKGSPEDNDSLHSLFHHIILNNESVIGLRSKYRYKDIDIDMKTNK